MPKTVSDVNADSGQRLDQWLWFARVAKTRTLATKLVETGKTRINRTRVAKASRTVRPGDVITLMLHGHVRILKVLGCGTRRGPAQEAQLLYEDMSPPPPPRVKDTTPTATPAFREKGAGRPTKRDRRRIDAWNSNESEPVLKTDEP